MGRIKDTDIYNFDEFLSLDDYLIGTDADSPNGKTKNYKLGNIFATFKSALQLTSLEFTFSDGSDPDLDETDPAYFTANDTNAGAITSLLVNKQAMSGADISVLVDMVAENVSSFMVRLNKPSAASEIFYFQIVSITDQVTHYSIIVTNFVGGETLVDGTTYGLVFDLAGVPSIFNETDPVFLASDAAAVTAAKIANWDTAFTWGNHASVGYLTAETDPVFSASAASTILLGDIANWDAAYSYGDHAVAGYITSESDPTVGAHIKSISTGDINNWNLAYGWGDHSLAGYLTAETDAVFLASPAADITELDTTNWDAAFLWGNHALFGYLREINIDTLAELNGIVTDATLIDTLDSRLSDARTPLAHSHVEADISDLQPYLLAADITGKVDKVGDTMTGLLNNTVGITTKYIGLDRGSSESNAENVFSSVSAPVGSIVVASNTTASINFPSAFGQGLYVRGAGETRDFAFWRNNSDNNSSIYVGNKNGTTWVWNQLWHAGSDGVGSGLDADLVHGRSFTSSGNRWNVHTAVAGDGVLEIGRYIDFHSTSADATDTTFRINNSSTGFLNFEGTIEVDGFTSSGTGIFHGASFWRVSAADLAAQRADSREDNTDESRLHWYGLNEAQGTECFRHAWYDGSNYCNITYLSDVLEWDSGTENLTFKLTSTANVTLLLEADNDNVTETHNPLIRLSQDGGIKGFEIGVVGNAGAGLTGTAANDTFLKTDTTAENIHWGAATTRRMTLDNGNGNLTLLNGGLTVGATASIIAGSGGIRRLTTDDGILVGSYSDDGALTTSAGAIYAMGTSFKPSSTTDFGNMYGVGYCFGSVMNGTNGDIGTTAASQWGFYVAADGEARLWFNATAGISRQKGAAYASNFILNSDRRRKLKIEDYKAEPLNVKWQSFELDSEEGQYRVGVIAQDLLENPATKGFVNEEDPENYTVNYIDLHSAALAQKDKEIEDLTSRIEKLEKMIMNITPSLN